MRQFCLLDELDFCESRNYVMWYFPEGGRFRLCYVSPNEEGLYPQGNFEEGAIEPVYFDSEEEAGKFVYEFNQQLGFDCSDFIKVVASSMGLNVERN